MSYKIKNPQNIKCMVESLRKAELDVQNIKNSSRCPLTTYNALQAEKHLNQVHKCIVQMAKDGKIDESTITGGMVTAAWPGGK